MLRRHCLWTFSAHRSFFKQSEKSTHRAQREAKTPKPPVYQLVRVQLGKRKTADGGAFSTLITKVWQ